MAFKRLVNFYIFILSILAVNLITDKITSFLLSYKHMNSPAKVTLIGMGVMVFILFPAYNYLDDLSGKLVKRVFKAGKNAGGKFFGITLAFFLCLGILFLFYMYAWFGWSAIRALAGF